MQIIVQEMLEVHTDNLGQHAWVDIVFDSGRTITVRVDEKDFHSDMSRVFVRRDDNSQHSKEFCV